MGYVYKKIIGYATILLFSVLMPVKIVCANGTEPASTITDDKTMAVLNEMLQTLQQPVNPGEKGIAQTLPIAPVTSSEQAVVPSQSNTVLPQADRVNAPANAMLDQANNNIAPQPIISNAVPLVSESSPMQEQSPSKELVAQGQEIESLEKEKIDEKVGIDTLNLTEAQGNWLFKSIWYSRAQERYESIRKLVDMVWNLRSTFLEKRTELDRAVLDPFYISIGLRMGELQEVLADLVVKFNAERNKDGDLNVQERALFQEVKAEQQVIETLHNQVKVVTELDHRIDESLSKLMDQLNKVRAYEHDAWDNFKKISQLLSDTKARELYYAMDIQMRNIKDIQKYLQNDFKSYFYSTVDRITQEITAIQQSVERLKEQGVDFKTQADVLFQAIVHPVKKEEIVEKNEDVSELDKEQVNKKQSFLTRIVNILSNLLELITYPVKKLFRVV